MSHIFMHSCLTGSIQEGSFEVLGKKYKFLYKQRMYGKTPRFLVVLGVWNEESCCFEIDNMVDEVVSEFEEESRYFKDLAKVEEKIATKAKKAPAPIKKVCKKPSKLSKRCWHTDPEDLELVPSRMVLIRWRRPF